VALVLAGTALFGIFLVAIGVSWMIAPQRSVIDARLSRYGSRQPSWRELSDASQQQRGSQLSDTLTRTMEPASTRMKSSIFIDNV